MSEKRKYAFNWDAAIGNMDIARPSLGPTTRVEVYRLMQFTFRDVLEQKFGTEMADEIFFEAGRLAGTSFYEQHLAKAGSFNELVKTLQSSFEELKIGVLRIESVNEDPLEVTQAVSEDLDCSGLPELDYEVCTYDEGFIAGILGMAYKKEFSVKEIDCWCTGDRTCRFLAKARPAEGS